VPSLREAFITALPAELRASWQGRAELDDALARAVDESVARFGAWLDPPTFAAYLATQATEASTGETATPSRSPPSSASTWPRWAPR
jgi:hypothetical protein